MRTIILRCRSLALSALFLGVVMLALTFGHGCGAPIGAVADNSAVRGDLDGDGLVTQADLDLASEAFGLKEGDPGFIAAADLFGDGVIGLDDIQGLVRIFESTDE